MKKRIFILTVIVIAQFLCTSLWFAGNGIINDLISAFDLNESSLANLTSSVQFGFLVGTLLFSLLNIADRFSPSIVFFFCALAGALCNLGIIYSSNTFISLMALRFSTGFFLAGIYPVGMKIAADYFNKQLGKSLGFLVGALVLGTSLPHLLTALKTSLPWESVIAGTSILAVLGGGAMLVLIPDGPFRKRTDKLHLNAIVDVFKNKSFRSAAFGYFGHMWELYTFWVFIPLILKTYNTLHPESSFNISLWSFIIIAIGSLACVVGGYLSLKWGEQKIATAALLLSGICCLISPTLFLFNEIWLFFLLLIWGFAVIMDSPLFSTLVAKNAPKEIKGTALTIVNCVGFSLTIVSIQTINFLSDYINIQYLFMFLVIGPVFALLNSKKDSVY
ncbi:putative MFS family arabinose efflux permease [Tenacibaculum skagerrakense]|uniref:Putative MFS family arabinose efflux permease n=1 Tax=Tenacibaculum skagerrakense TaxID=186571 RepID=A0A4R2NUV4_9FLAO|nr:MFS transporter [Tenacibaculum skagerrakense]TCP25707.1 putative MFS family arabinose efflux permease [Tenacibaculum skagerrakense]